MTREGAGRGGTGRRALERLLDRVFAIRPLLWIPARIFGAGRVERELGLRVSAALIASLLLIPAVHAAKP
jgi:hypothetical protein